MTITITFNGEADYNRQSAEDFAEHVLRNYSIEERAALGKTPIEQAYSVIDRNFRAYESRRKHESGKSKKRKERDK